MGRAQAIEAIRVDYHCPDYLKVMFKEKQFPYLVQETTAVRENLDITSYLTAEYALGSASRSCGGQSNNVVLHYRKPSQKVLPWGILYCRYISNDKTLANSYSSGNRSSNKMLVEEGACHAVQHENKVIALYDGPDVVGEVSSLKLDIMMLHYSKIEEVWINDEKVRFLPKILTSSDVIFIKDANIYIAIRPLKPTNMGGRTPKTLEITNPNDNFTLSLYNYKGEPKNFWDYKRSSAFFKGIKGTANNGFILEVSDRNSFTTLGDFKRHIYAAKVRDITDENNIREVSYRSDPDEILIKYDKWNDIALERRINGKTYVSPMLNSPKIKQDDSGRIEISRSTLLTEKVPAWLFADEERGCYVAANLMDKSTPLRLSTLKGKVESESFAFGKIVYRPDDDIVKLDIMTTRYETPLRFTRPDKPFSVSLNGEDVTARIRRIIQEGRKMLELPKNL